MSPTTLLALALATPLFYLAYRWCRGLWSTRRFHQLGQSWGELERTWERLSRLPKGAHSSTVRRVFACLQRQHLQRIRKLGPQHARTAIHAKLISQYLRGSYTPPLPTSPPKTSAKLDAVRLLRQSLIEFQKSEEVSAGQVIRCDAELNQWQARLELDQHTSTAMRDALLGRKQQALAALTQALACLPRLPLADAEIWRGKLLAEQKRLRAGLGNRSIRRAQTV